MKNPDNNPAILAFLSAFLFGLASFVIWVLRLKPSTRETASAPLPGGSRPSLAVAEPHRPQLALDDSIIQPSNNNPPESLDKNMAPADEIPQPKADASDWSVPTRYLAGVGIILFVLWLINYSRQTLSMLIFAAILAILAQPVSNFFQKRLRFSHGLAITITYLFMAALIVVLPILIMPNIATGINAFVNYDWENLIGSVSNALDQTAQQVSNIPLVGISFANSLAGLGQLVQGWLTAKPEPVSSDPSAALEQLGNAVGILGGLVGPLISGIMSLVFMLLISLQISLSGEQIRGWIINPTPERFKKEISALLDRIQNVWKSFLHGEFVLMVVMGLLTWLLNVILGTPQAVLLGFLAGLLEVVPSLGPILATIPAAILALIFGSTVFPGLNPWVFMLIVILGYVLLQAVENQVLVPKILGNAVSLPPLIVLIGVTIAGATAGVAGIFLATPVMATGRELLIYVYEKIIAAPEPEREPPEEDQPSMMVQVRDFVSKFRLPIRQAGKQDKGSSSTGMTE